MRRRRLWERFDESKLITGKAPSSFRFRIGDFMIKLIGFQFCVTDNKRFFCMIPLKTLSLYVLCAGDSNEVCGVHFCACLRFMKLPHSTPCSAKRFKSSLRCGFWHFLAVSFWWCCITLSSFLIHDVLRCAHFGLAITVSPPNWDVRKFQFSSNGF